MAEVVRLPRMTSNNSSFPEPDRCPHCGREKKSKTMTFLGVTITVTPACQCEINAFERDIERFKNYKKRQRLEAMKKNSGLVGNAVDYTFERFKPRPGTEKAFGVARDFVRNFTRYRETGEAFTLIGQYGNGKSHLAAAVVHELIAGGIPASFQVVPELLKRVKAAYDGYRGETEAEILDFLQNVQCLVLDDVGAQKQTKWAEEFLYTVIDHRYRCKLPTIVTSNCNATDGEDSLTAALGDRAVDRLLERNLIIKVTASSYRREIAKRKLARIGGTCQCENRM